VRLKAIDMMMEMIKGDLAALHIKHDVFFSERSLMRPATTRSPRPSIICVRRAMSTKGAWRPPKGQAVEDYEDREQTLFRATAFGDDVDRPLIKSDRRLYVLRPPTSPTTRTSSIAVSPI